MSQMKRRVMVIGTAFFLIPAMGFVGSFAGLFFCVLADIAFGDSEDDLFYWMITGAVAFGIAGIFVGRNEANKQYRKMRAKQEKKEAEARQAGESPVSLSNIAESSGPRP